MDREKVMSWLEGLAQQDWRMFHSDSEVQVIAESALALLKEQEAVVHCEDCKYYDSFSQECRNGIDGIMTPNFYCGNAEHKEGR